MNGKQMKRVKELAKFILENNGEVAKIIERVQEGEEREIAKEMLLKDFIKQGKKHYKLLKKEGNKK